MEISNIKSIYLGTTEKSLKSELTELLKESGKERILTHQLRRLL